MGGVMISLWVMCLARCLAKVARILVVKHLGAADKSAEQLFALFPQYSDA